MTNKIFDSWTARILALMSVVAGVYYGIHVVVRAEVSDLNGKMETASTNIARLQDGMLRADTDIKKTNERIDKALTDALDKLVAGKTTAANQSTFLGKGQTILSIARSIDAKLGPDSLERYGKSVSLDTKYASLTRAAWRSLVQAIDYRTFLNADYAPKPSDFTPATGHEDYQNSINLLPDRPVSPNVPAVKVFFAGGHVQQERSARLELLTKPQSHGSGFAFFVIEGGNSAVVLDGMYIRNGIVRNARVVYNGAPMRLEHVYFVNCTFRFPMFQRAFYNNLGTYTGVPRQAEPTRAFGEAILRAAEVTLSTMSPIQGTSQTE